MKKPKWPFHLKRHPTLHEVPIGGLHSDDTREHDTHFVRLYQSYMQGRIKGRWTRIHLDFVLPGLIKHEKGKVLERIEYPQDKEHAYLIAAQIRKGSRPALTLYPSFLDEHKGKLICCDDLVSFYAYESLGIKTVPALVLGKSDLGSESAIVSKFTKDGSIRDLELAAKNRTHAMMSLGGGKDLPFGKAAQKLSSHIELCLESITAFDQHEEAERKVRYHETLFSIAYRFKEGLAALEALDERGFLLQGRPIVRSLYELFLNFYLDWLCPEQMGPLLQTLAEVGRLPGTDERRKLEKLVRERFGGLVDLCETVSQKGRMSPLGEVGHERIYSRLSPVAHQDFSVTQEYVHLLSSGNPVVPSQEEIEFLINVLDIVICATANRILDDVGAAARFS
jgi:hypothetical protein